MRRKPARFHEWFFGVSPFARFEGEAATEPEADKGAGGGGNDKVPESKPDPTERRHRIVGSDGRTYSFNDEEMAFLAAQGLAKEIEATKKKEEPKDPPVSDKEKKEASAADVLARLDKMEKERADEKRQAQINARREAISKEVSELLDGQEVLKGNKKLMDFARRNVLSDIVANPNKSIPDIVKDVMEVLTEGKTTSSKAYVEGKKKDRENTKGVSAKGGGEGVVSGEVKFSGADLASGKLRKHLAEKLGKARKSEFV